eukprot:TRINITY_DN3491_c0_g1_i1.p1 TRINITY_DN3491_c0_g1~~TRINITY_DN3491_c0_g1_i1.p1  ORF type:complete len:381 (-),score=59.03 TRINITY_DN3491_c0_g1_i1:664-1806(-)
MNKVLKSCCSNFNKAELQTHIDKGTPVDEHHWETHMHIKDLLINARVEQAEEVLRRECDGSLFHCLMNVEISFWKYGYHQTDEHLEEVKERIGLLDRISTMVCDKYRPESGLFKSKSPRVNEKTKLVLYMEGQLASGVVQIGNALVYFQKSNWMKSAYYIHKAWNKFSKANSLVGSLEEKGYSLDIKTDGAIKFFLGIFHFGVSMIPPAFKWVGKVIGFKGDRSLALQEIQYAVDSKTSLFVEARLLLVALNYYFFDNETCAILMLEDVMDRYPESSVMWYAKGLFNRTSGDVNESIVCLQRCLQYVGSAETLKTNAHFNLGYSYFLKNMWEEAREQFEIFIRGLIYLPFNHSDNPQPNFKPYASYLLGYCYTLIQFMSG